MTESQILTLNERVKGFSYHFYNLSAALLAAAVARLWVKGSVDLAVGMWLAGAGGLLWLGWSVLYLLEPSSEETG